MDLNKKIMTSIFVDFNSVDNHGRLRLNNHQTLIDVNEKKIKLRNGGKLSLNDHDGLITAGTVEFSEQENIWVARVV
ncbi:hypothetical protein ACXZ1K_11425 [Pedobacter sp. PWIIR3]